MGMSKLFCTYVCIARRAGAIQCHTYSGSLSNCDTSWLNTYLSGIFNSSTRASTGSSQAWLTAYENWNSIYHKKSVQEPPK